MTGRWQTVRHSIAAALVAAAVWFALSGGDGKASLGLLVGAGVLMAVDVVDGYRTGRAVRDAYRRHRGRRSC
jgi:hypothetical protein